MRRLDLALVTLSVAALLGATGCGSKGDSTTAPTTPSTATSTITASLSSLAADGVSNTTITVRLKIASGAAYPHSGGTVALQTTLGTLGAVTDHGDGTYTATLLAPTTLGIAAITGTLNGQAFMNNAAVTVVAGAPSLLVTTLSVVDTVLTADGVASTVVTVHVKDTFGNPVTTGAGPVTIQTTSGALGSVTQAADAFSATLTAPTTVGSTTLSAKLNSQAIAATASIRFAAGAVSLTKSAVTVADSVVTADGVSGTTATVYVRDANGNAVTSGATTVAIASTKGTVGSVTAASPGVYTATLTSPTASGSATVSAKINTQPLVASSSVRFSPGLVSLSRSTLTAADSVLTADGSSSTVVTVQTKDAHDNIVTVSVGPVTLTTSKGTLGTVTAAGGGTYTAILTTGTISGQASLSGQLNGQPMSATPSVRFAPGPLTQFVVEASGGGAIPAQNAGHSFGLRISAEDAHANVATQFTGTVVITSTGSLSRGAGTSASLVAGVLANQVVTLSDGGSFTITATASGGTASGTSAVIIVAPGVIVYMSNQGGTAGFLYRVNADGTGEALIPGAVTSNEGYPVWSHSATRLLYTGQNDLWSMNSDGTGRTNLTNDNSDSQISAWSPDDSKIAWGHHTNRSINGFNPFNSEIWVMNANGTGGVSFSDTTHDSDQPDWSPDGTRILFVQNDCRSAPCTYALYVMNPDGTLVVQLTATGARPFARWSPDGSRIAFDCGGICVMNADGTAVVNLGGSVVGGPSWSPDGARIAYIAQPGSIPQLWVMNADGSNQHAVTTSSAVPTIPPSWRP